jgi:hypothetical protein
MKRKNLMGHTSLAAIYSMADDTGEGEGGGGGQALADIQSAIDSAVSAATAPLQGLSTKNTELMSELKDARRSLKAFEGVDVEGLLALQKTVEGDEVLKLAAAGDHTGAIEKATERLQVTHQSEMTTINEQMASLRLEAETNTNLVQSLLIDGGAQQSFMEVGGRQTALEDVAARARKEWRVEDGEPVARDENGLIRAGAKGPLTMSEWAANLKEIAPHLFPNSEGGDLGGGDSGAEGSNSLEAQILAATNSGDFSKLRELRKVRDSRVSR